MNTLARLFLFAAVSGVPAVLACTGRLDVVPSETDGGSAPDGATPIPPATGVPTANPADAAPAPTSTSLPAPSFDAGPASCGTGPNLDDATLAQAFGGGWRAPGAPQQACTQTDVDALKALFKGGSTVKFEDVKSTLGATCAACAFRPASSPTWGPFVESSGGGTYVNYAACFALASNVTCGRDLANYELCLDTACDDAVCGTTPAKQACAKSAASAQCKTFSDAFAQSCSGKLETVSDRCSNIFQVIGATCGGGLDAAAP